MSYKVYIPPGINYEPYPHEKFAARIMAKYFNADVIFIKKHDTAKSADLKIENRIWEIKSPIGDGKYTMQNNLRDADGQSSNIVINLVRCKMSPEKAISRLNFQLKKAHKVKRLLVILKSGKVVVLK